MFIVLPLVSEVHSISPSSGILKGGTEVTIHGENLGFMQYCKFGSVKGSTSFISPDGKYLKCISPAGTQTGAVPIQVPSLIICIHVHHCSKVSDSSKLDSIWLPVSPLRTTLFTYYGIYLSFD